MRLDTRYSVNTPEGIELVLCPAGPVPRTLAWLVDLAIRLAIYLLLGVTLAFMGRMGTGIAMILVFLLEWFYPVWFELRHAGQTPGKKLMHIYVAQLDASPVTPAASIIRNLLRAVDILPFLYGFGLISTLVTKRFQRLGDLAANTVVLHKAEANPQLKDFDDPAQRPETTLTLQEQQAVILFAQRQHTLTEERQQELAAMSGPLVAEKTNAAAYIRGVASWLTGRKA